MFHKPIFNHALFKRLILSVALVLSVIFIYMMLTGANPGDMKLREIVYSVALIYVGWIISAVRLYYILRAIYNIHGKSFISCLNARFLGDIFAKITPSSLGGEPARAYYISVSLGTGFLENYAITIYEVYYDVVFTCIAGFIASLFFLPRSIPVLATSTVTLLLWISFFNSIQASFVDKLMSYLHSALGKYKVIGSIIEKFKEFRNYYVQVSSKMKIRDKAIIWLLTLMVNFTWAISIIPLIHASSLSTGLLYRSLVAYAMMQAISILPTPGGSGVAEYGLTIVLDPSTVVAYRLIYYFAPMIYGLLVLSYLLVRKKGK